MSAARSKRSKTSKRSETSGFLTLSQATVGQDFLIQDVEGPNCERLRDLGFCESLRVKKLAHGRNLICSVCGTRMAISRELAEAVMVRPL